MKINSEVHKIRIMRIVDKIMKEKITPFPFDYLFRSTIQLHPEVTHNVLNLPGEYDGYEDTSLFVKNKHELKMDYLEKVIIKDNEVFNEALTNLEHETKSIKKGKKDIIFEFVYKTMFHYGKFCYSYVATNHDYKEDTIHYEKDGAICIMHLIIFNKEKIYKILNTLNEKDYIKNEFTETDLVNFIHCLVFAKDEFAKDVVRKLVKLFTRIKNITEEMQKELSSALCLMIKYHFTDEKEIRRLLTMITESLPQTQQENLPFQVKLQNRLAKKDDTIAEMSNALDQKDNTIAERDNTIAEKDKVIEKEIREKEFFKALLDENNIPYSFD